MEKQIVWQFTNQRRLNKKEFLDYFERKIFRTIRKYQMLPADKIILLKTADDLNTQVLKQVLEKKFKVEFSSKPNFSSDNLSQVAEDVFKNILAGRFGGAKPDSKLKKPLYFLSDAEVELYTKLAGIRGKKRKQDKKIQKLFARFFKKNPDLEQNIVKAGGQIIRFN